MAPTAAILVQNVALLRPALPSLGEPPDQASSGVQLLQHPEDTLHRNQQASLTQEDALRNEPGDDLREIDDLAHAKVDRDAGE